MAADEFRSRVDDDVSAVIERTEEVRRSKGIVDDDRQAVFMGNGSDGFEVGNVDGRIAEAFEVDGLGLVVDLFGKGLRIIGIGKVRRNAKCLKVSVNSSTVPPYRVGAAMISSPAPAKLMIE